MRTWIVQIRRKRRSEFPTSFWLEDSDAEARELEERIRAQFEAGKIKDFLFEPVQVSWYNDVDHLLVDIERGFKSGTRATRFRS